MNIEIALFNDDYAVHDLCFYIAKSVREHFGTKQFAKSWLDVNFIPTLYDAMRNVYSSEEDKAKERAWEFWD